MQQQGDSLILALAPNRQLHLVLLRLAELIHPHTNDFHLEGCGSLAGVDHRLSDARLEIAHRAVASP